MKIKAYLLLILFPFAVSCAAQRTTDKTWTGITEEKKLSDSFSWFSEGYDRYSPDSSSINELKNKLPEYTILVFGGVWCSDTQELLPKFYKTTDLSGLSKDKIDLYLVDRRIKSPQKLERKYGITAVPTFILLKDNREVGRIVEHIDKSIEADLVNLIHNSGTNH